MSIQQVNLGNYANDGQGDDLRTAFEKYNVSVSDLDQTRVIGADNLGAGAPVYVDKVDKNLKFRSIIEGGTPGNVFITYSESEIIIAVRDAIGHVQEDPNPILGGNLNLNTHSILGLGAIDITGNITADKFLGVLDGDVIVPNGTLTLRAYNTNTQNYNTVFLNGFEISGNNVQANGTSILSTHVGDNFTLKSGGDLDIASETGKISIYQTSAPLQGGVQLGVDGTVTAIGFFGPVKGDVEGNVLGNVTGNLTGNVTGNLTGNVTGNVLGNVTGNVLGNVTGNVLGNLVGDTTGTHNGPVFGTVSDISNHVLADLGDVAATVPATGFVLKWNGNQWAAAPEAGGGGSAIPTDYDFGMINVSVTNPFELLLQASTISFGTFTEPSSVVWDLGPIAGVETNPTYTLSRSAASITEGQSATITLTTTNINDGSTIPYVVTGTGIVAGDFATFTLTGNFNIMSGTATVTIDTASDIYIEGTEIMTLTLAGISPPKSITISILDNTPMDGGGPSTASFDDTSDGGSPGTAPAISYDGGSV